MGQKKKEMIIGIYCITSPSNRIYIGSSVNIERRFKQYKRLQCKKQKALYNSLVKYGYDNHKFQIICICEKEKLLWHEQYYIDNFKPELNIAKVVGRPPILRGEENHMWKGGISSHPDYKKIHNQLPSQKERRNIHSQKEEVKARKKEYDKVRYQTEEYKQKQRERYYRKKEQCKMGS